MVAILSNGENGYRDSPVTEAVELRTIIQQARPDLYELMATEEKREEQKAEPEIKRSIVPVNASNGIELDSYIPKPQELSPLYTLPKKLENKVVIPYQDQMFLYHGEITGLEFKQDFRSYLWGTLTFTKYAREKKIKKIISFFPPRITSERAFKDKELWKLVVGDSISNGIVFSGGGNRLYPDELIRKAMNQYISLPRALIEKVFSPIDQQLQEIYNNITSSA